MASPTRGTVTMSLPRAVDFGPEICSSLETAAAREWLVTNGIGGFASGTVAGVLTRRYHGLFVPALLPPVGRTLIVSKCDETIRYDARCYELGANRWAGGAVVPDGFRRIVRFHLEGTTPVWTFACADALLEKRIWMQKGASTTFVRYEMLRGSAGRADVEIKVLVNYRDIDATTQGADWRMNIQPVAEGLRIVAREGATPFYLLARSANVEARHDWYRNFDLAAEARRGLEDREDQLLAGIFRARLRPGSSVTLVFTTDPDAPLDGTAAFSERAAAEEELLEYWIAAQPRTALNSPAWIRQLVLAASQFPVRRPLADDPDGESVIAGYPWFGDWGRDTLIALPGLALETGRTALARRVLKTFGGLVDQGMLPNVFPEAGEPPAYNTVDAALWFFEAVRQYHKVTSDAALIGELFPALEAIVDWHVHGARYSIRMDPADGLLHAGELGSQLTWMDARVGEVPVTPRAGKPVEVNALWYNALRTMARFAFLLQKTAQDYTTLAERILAGFGRYWNPEAGACFDVLDTPTGNDATLRPNQIIAVSLPENPLTEAQRKAVVDVCARRLVTPFGLRSLDPSDCHYLPRYGGSPEQRDRAYHQGTVWPWLLGPFVLAHLRAYRDPAQAFSFLKPMAHHLSVHGAGTISEIFDAEPPFAPRGALAQAWSVAEILRAWRACADAGLSPSSL